MQKTPPEMQDCAFDDKLCILRQRLALDSPTRLTDGLLEDRCFSIEQQTAKAGDIQMHTI